MSEAIDYRAVLADMRTRRAALDRAIAGLEAVLGESSSSGELGAPNGVGQEIQADTFVGRNISEATAHYLRMVGRPARSTEAVTEALNRGGLVVTQPSVGTVLLRSHNRGEGEIVRVGRGIWGLAEWYPGRPRVRRRDSEEEQKEEIDEMIKDEEERTKG
jgi:hypothetical protein